MQCVRSQSILLGGQASPPAFWQAWWEASHSLAGPPAYWQAGPGEIHSLSESQFAIQEEAATCSTHVSTLIWIFYKLVSNKYILGISLGGF